MRPYQKLARLLAVLALLLCPPVAVPVTTSHAAAHPATPPPSASAPTNSAEALTRSGLDQYYNSNYEQAIKDFDRVLEMRPQDAIAMNHLLAALIFRELYRAGALNSTLYSGDSFVNNKRPVDVDAATRARIREVTEAALRISEQRLQANPDDTQALYARGSTRALHATYLGLADKAWFAALRTAIGARHDHQRVLELDPRFADAKTVVGVHNYVAGSLPWAVKAAISVIGLSGSKTRGLEYLRNAADAGGDSSVDARVALAFFLRREQRYKESLDLVHTLVSAYPHNFLFALEEANLLKDWGKNDEALEAYRKLLAQAREGAFHDPRLEFADFDLGEILRGRHEYKEAAGFYESAAGAPRVSPELRQKSALAAGEMYDLLSHRDLALKQYEAAIHADGASPLAQTARRYMKEPYRAP